MSRLIFLLEERSMKVFLEGLLPRLYPKLKFLCVSHDGKQDLEKSIPRKLKGWREPGAQFLILRDNDGANCMLAKKRLANLCPESKRERTIVRLACQELEAWYFGDTEALSDAFNKHTLKHLGSRESFRDPDAIPRPSDELAKILPEFQKVSGARRMADFLCRERNRSRSFNALLEAIERIAL